MYIVDRIGHQHVGIGSDFDGVDRVVPIGLDDVADYPALFEELARRGLSDAQLADIASNNLMRVFEATELTAASHPMRTVIDHTLFNGTIERTPKDCAADICHVGAQAATEGAVAADSAVCSQIGAGA